ncbi:MAG: hypothetical protein HY815_19775 [Candidatus Riflebacteria bacterium]|nr:hypothetical protein [Candidatus Riflebacteria bacterium]
MRSLSSSARANRGPTVLNRATSWPATSRLSGIRSVVVHSVPGVEQPTTVSR